MVEQGELLTTSDAAKVLSPRIDYVRALERQGRLPARKTRSGQRLFLAADVQVFAEECAAKQEVGDAVHAAR